MKTRYHLIIAILLGIVMTGSVIFVIFSRLQFEKEHYEIEITGMKDVYLVREPYDFFICPFRIWQFCGSKTVHYPDENGKEIKILSSASCVANTPMKNFVFDLQKEQGTT